MSADVQEVIEKMVIVHMSAEELAAFNDEFEVNIGSSAWVDECAPPKMTTIH
ncbi:hypothetical protein GR204_27555 [Rhizobium leguminosarum]|uniref:Uncharacterized protein n=1 Tax=Rhizobium leguminosarum TaxID=384 RepID=A0A6P0BD08_RHILE|nr:hypothetical protein [Rhizobium leguminosarum]MBY5846417.1 hypothetical protein [Rhizobium leguminosarum]NEI37675.1 hypothetical protein [Rhizobium leguminosarum]